MKRSVYMCVCMCVHARACVCVTTLARVCVRACVHTCVCYSTYVSYIHHVTLHYRFLSQCQHSLSKARPQLQLLRKWNTRNLATRKGRVSICCLLPCHLTNLCIMLTPRWSRGVWGSTVWFCRTQCSFTAQHERCTGRPADFERHIHSSRRGKLQCLK